ncbi:DNA alkylation repair enzyme [Methanococcus vannielii SB]|uniref:DNA alkylation repair enzyme n=1 Tax=Methanococcus vannielii (strain ATCC 35089 / DSM 1224 / JCM 13029 / OCM 148 / SB) TaxID=406327 RepID=A6URL3_METVS|nr:DNA alkylation repair protein [Methanococcus vannielii]ABR55135.1 DNA alkylation repair enzyme [Methanococcus vannielii SB]
MIEQKFIDNDNILEVIIQVLGQNSDEKTKLSGSKFFKEQIKLHGVKVSTVTKISKEYFEYIKNCDKNEILSLCETLFSSGYLEEQFIACNWSYYLKNQYSMDDFITFERRLNQYVTNWASCDTPCNHTIGTFIEMYPNFIQNIITWTKSNNRWLRRGAAVTLIIPARKGKFIDEIFQIANNLFSDKEDLVQKGYGWMLKAASESHEKEVFEYVIKNKSNMPRTALRYSIEKMSKELKEEVEKINLLYIKT